MKLAQEFKQFLLRGNVVDLAVAFVLGAAFGAVVEVMSEAVEIGGAKRKGGVPFQPSR